MINLLLAILSSATIAIIMRASTNRVQGRLTMLSVNYLVCFTLAALYTDFGGVSASGSVGLILGMGAINGFFYLASFIMLQNSTRVNGVVLSTIFMKLGLLVPMAVSIIFFDEVPTALQIIGSAVAVAAIILINFEKEGRAIGSKLLLILLLVGGGAGNVMSKIFEEKGPADLSQFFLFITFAMAFIMCSILVIVKKQKVGFKEIAFGALIGVPNFFSAKFLLASLYDLPAVIVNPTYSVGAILVVTLAGVAFFKEKLGKRQWIALAAILAALVMLNV